MQVASEAILKIFNLLAIEGVHYAWKLFNSFDDFDQSESDASEILSKWLDSIYGKFYKRSFELLKEKKFESVGFNAVMQIIRLSSTGVIEDFAFPVEILRELIESF